MEITAATERVAGELQRRGLGVDLDAELEGQAPLAMAVELVKRVHPLEPRPNRRAGFWCELKGGDCRVATERRWQGS